MVGLTIDPARGGFLTASLKVKINREELVHPLRELGIESSELCLVFGNCWQVKANLLGYGSAPEVIAAFEIEHESGLKQRFLSSDMGSHRMTHFRITGSIGSQLDFVGETFSVNELSNGR